MIDNRFLLEDGVTFMMTEDDAMAIEQEGPRGTIDASRTPVVLPATSCVCIP